MGVYSGKPQQRIKKETKNAQHDFVPFKIRRCVLKGWIVARWIQFADFSEIHVDIKQELG